jgi:hypothetical protein
MTPRQTARRLVSDFFSRNHIGILATAPRRLDACSCQSRYLAASLARLRKTKNEDEE